MENADLNYALARRALLDALGALGAQRSAVIVCGAQAIYLHTGEGDFVVSPRTFDADLLIHPELLLKEPALPDAMTNARFQLDDEQPGIWHWAGARIITVDLLVAESMGGPGRRGARLGVPHGNKTARKVKGLEAALIDNASIIVGALDARDKRSFDVAVAGPGALVVSKLHKVAERLGQTDGRQDDKDALDILRLLRAVSTEELAKPIAALASNEVAKLVTAEAIIYLERFFSRDSHIGAAMASRAATADLEERPTIAASCAALASDLLEAITASTPDP